MQGERHTVRSLAGMSGRLCNYTQLGSQMGLMLLGVILYDGADLLPLGENILAAPLST